MLDGAECMVGLMRAVFVVVWELYALIYVKGDDNRVDVVCTRK